jgi:hypothetical protein
LHQLRSRARLHNNLLMSMDGFKSIRAWPARFGPVPRESESSKMCRGREGVRSRAHARERLGGEDGKGYRRQRLIQSGDTTWKRHLLPVRSLLISTAPVHPSPALSVT